MFEGDKCQLGGERDRYPAHSSRHSPSQVIHTKHWHSFTNCSKRLLRGSDYYSSAGVEVPTTAGGPFKEEELVMGKLLYRLRLVQDMNAHPIWGVEPDPRDCSRVATHNIGVKYFIQKLRIVTMSISGGGFYSAIASYFNSDCNPNTVRINMGREMFLVTTRNIRKGEWE